MRKNTTAAITWCLLCLISLAGKSLTKKAHRQYMSMLFFLIVGSPHLLAQLPQPALVGYFQNWSSVNTPYVQLSQVDPRYNVIDVAFALPMNGTDYRMQFVPDQVSQQTFISQMQGLQNAGKKVLISIGGATAPITLSNNVERDSFIASMGRILDVYNFDGIDLDFEGSSMSVSGGTIANPVDQPIIRMIYAVQMIMDNYRQSHNKKLLLTLAPETAFIQGGQSSYGGMWGAYLPLVDALRDSIDLLHVQLYNSGSMYGINGVVYNQGTADFIVAMTDAVIQGFNTNGGFFAGFPQEKVAVGLPACSQAAGSGYTDTATVAAAMRYLLGQGPQPGSYTITNGNAYPNLGGMMTWSINWDSQSACGGAYSYADNFEQVYNNLSTAVQESPIAELNEPLLFPNPSRGTFTLRLPRFMTGSAYFRLMDSSGRLLMESRLLGNDEMQITAEGIRPGTYVWYVDEFSGRMVIE